MKKQDPNRIAALVLAAFAGLSAGLLLPGPDRWTGLTEANEAAVVEAFSISPIGGETSMEMSAPPAVSETPAALLPVQTPAPLPSPEETPLPTPAPDAAAFSITLLSTQPPKESGSILIYHTQTYEAYEQSELRYQETEKWRTADPACNMIRVGEELAALLRGLGYRVVHDTTAFEPPELSSAYSRSLTMLEERIAAGESYDLYIDLHRDAYVEGQAGSNTVQAGGTAVAKLMLLIGKGEGYTGTGYDQKPDWEANLQVAQAITDALNEQLEGLGKNVRLKSGRFNQHVDTGCVLVEVGNNRNSLTEALAAMPYLADAIHRTLSP